MHVGAEPPLGPRCTQKKKKKKKIKILLLIFNFFIYFWVTQFILAFVNLTLQFAKAGSTACM